MAYYAPIRRPDRHRFTINKKVVLFALLAVVLLAAPAGSVYYWQQQRVWHAAARADSLAAQLVVAKQPAAEPSSPAPSAAPPAATTFEYAPKTGGLKLTLSTTLGVVVSVDGNKGGAPGAAFRVVTVTDAHVLGDSAYHGVEVDIDHTFTTLAAALDSVQSQLHDAGVSGCTVSDTAVAGLAAKKLACDGPDEYVGKVDTYVTGSGEFTYTITANGTQLGVQNPDILGAVLKGLAIQPKKL